jgi:ABC-type multidrug transport system fused ATPase/permease subunit
VADVSLSVPPGRRIAVVGPSGAGKSSIAFLLLRFLPYESGSVRLNDVELDRLAGDDVRTAVGYVAQDAHLFDTTIAQNLRVGRRDASEQELREVVGRVGLLDWLDSLPAGLETAVGPAGSRLSGGQRRRIAVARALLARFDVLVLDEPTEHLDRAAADALTADLLSLTRGRSTILVTHRLDGLEAVDEVVVLSGGRLSERGSHARLLAAGGGYAALWEAEQAFSSSAPETPDPAASSTDGRKGATNGSVIAVAQEISFGQEELAP